MKEIKEIERRFLLKKLPKYINWDKIYRIQQFYIKDGDLTKRVREKTDVSVSSNFETSFEYLHKINKGVGEFVEMHEDIDANKYCELKPKAFKTIAKDRFVHIANGLHFEIDRIDGISLVILEVELDDINQEIIFPFMIEEEIITEITGIKELSNFNLETHI